MNKYLEKLKRLEEIFKTENPSKIEIELGKKILIELYEEISFVIPATNPVTKQEEPSEKIETENIAVQEKTPETTSKDIKDDIVAEVPEEDNVEQPHDENVTEEITTEEKTQEPTSQESSQPVVNNAETISEKLGNNSKSTLYDMIKEIKNDTDLVTYLANKPIENISKSITLNDKIMFIKELFGGDSNKYSEAVEKLNNAANLEEALEILATYHIDTGKESAGEFIRILYRRFAV